MCREDRDDQHLSSLKTGKKRELGKGHWKEQPVGGMCCLRSKVKKHIEVERTHRPDAAEKLRKTTARSRPLDLAAGRSRMTLASAFSGAVGVRDLGKLQRGFPVGSANTDLPAVQETLVQPLGREDLLEKGMATPSRILAWRIPWTEEPGGL